MYRVITIYELSEGTDLSDALECIERQISECMSVPHCEIGADPDTVKLVEETLDAAAGAEIEIPEDLPAALESIRSAYHREAGT